MTPGIPWPSSGPVTSEAGVLVVKPPEVHRRRHMFGGQGHEARDNRRDTPQPAGFCGPQKQVPRPRPVNNAVYTPWKDRKPFDQNDNRTPWTQMFLPTSKKRNTSSTPSCKLARLSGQYAGYTAPPANPATSSSTLNLKLCMHLCAVRGPYTTFNA